MDFTSQIVDWYKLNRRSLPWRDDPKPYHVWLSEIIMQQTRMDQGLKYWLKFTSTYPTVRDLADASSEEVMKMWQGLGYYNRARNLHATAKYVAYELDGHFPNNHKGLLALKGVGPYTAAAIGSIAFDIPEPAVDGNVLRVFSRYFGIEEPIDGKEGKKAIEALAEEHLDRKDPGTYNQAVMEFGALMCKPKLPKCDICPLQEGCVALREDMVDELPLKTKKTKTRDRHFNFIVARTDSHIYMEKRGTNDIWAELYQFPLIESNDKVSSAKDLEEDSTYRLQTSTENIQEPETEYKHILSHQKIYARFWKVDAKQPFGDTSNLIKIPVEEIEGLAVPRLIERYLEDNSLLD